MGFRDILLLLLLVVILPSLCVEFGLHYYWFESRKRAEEQADLQLSRSVAATFDAYIHQLDRQEAALAQTIESLPSPPKDELERLLQAHASGYPALQRLILADAKGTVIADSRSGDKDASLAGSPWISLALASRQAVVTDVFQQGGRGAAVFVVARSVPGEPGRPGMVIVAIVVADRLAEANLAVDIGQGGEVTLFDRKGHEVYEYPGHGLTWRQRLAPESGDLVKQALDRHEATGIVKEANSTGDWFAARVPVADIGWAAGAGHSQQSVMSPLVHRMFIADILELLAVIFSFILAVLLSRSIIRGIVALHRRADAIAQGTWEDGGDSSRIVEFSQLGDAFKHMAAAREHMDSLQRQLAADRQRQAEFLRRLLDNAPIGIAVIDPKDGRYVMANSTYAAIPGMPNLELAGHAVGEFVPSETAGIHAGGSFGTCWRATNPTPCASTRPRWVPAGNTPSGTTTSCPCWTGPGAWRTSSRWRWR